KRAILASLAVFFLFINSFVIKQFTALGENGTFYRHLWAIPTVVIIGIAVVDLICILPKWYLRIPVIVAVVVGIWFINNHEHIRCRALSFSSDAKMVTQDVIELSEGFEKLREDTKKNALFIVCGNQVTELALYSGFLDVSDSSILNNKSHSGEEELVGANPDASYIMSTCCTKGMDYVVVAKNEGTKRVFTEHGYEPIFETSSSLVYYCSGFKGFKQDKTRWGLIDHITYYDEYGEPELQTMGYCTIQYGYDGRGNKSEEWYYGVNGELCKNNFGYAGIKLEYNFARRVIKESYYDVDSNLMNRTDVLYASKKLIRNKDGRVVKEEYLDKEGNPVLSSSGFASCRREYNETGRITKEIFYGTDGNPILLAAGYAGYIREFDERGNLTSESYLGTTGNIAARNTGYAQVRMKYDDLDRLVKETYWDESGEPYIIANGSHGFIREYDETGNEYIEIYIDVTGQEMVLQNGYSRVQREYDENKQLINERYFCFTKPFKR
ncbi:MAG: hypothetical protein K5644_09805, partial [Lachnospiraceae bacterium]|nr:hypothetical protein [Lachnospiraceae bacterium]